MRIDAKLDAGFVASIRERGVLEPIVCYPCAEGLVVQFGQRRCLAALQADRDVVPVFVVDEPSEVDRLTDQIIENDQRADLSTSERVKGWEQLAGFGLSASVIPKRTGAKGSQVETGLRVSSSELATKAGERWSFLTPGPGLSSIGGCERCEGTFGCLVVAPIAPRSRSSDAISSCSARA